MEEQFYQFYLKCRRVIAPSLRYSQDLYAQALQEYVWGRYRWLDLGCGHRVLPAWREPEECRLVSSCASPVGVDYDLPALRQHRSIPLRVRGDITELPFARDSFDVATANMVVEHLDDPEAQFREIHRVLKPRGRFIFHTPNGRGYLSLGARLIPDRLKRGLIRLLDGRKQEDIFKTYYRANTRREIQRLASATGFEVEEIRMVVSSAVFALFPPLVVPELVWIRILMTRPFAELRTNLIAVLSKQPTAEGGGTRDVSARSTRTRPGR